MIGHQTAAVNLVDLLGQRGVHVSGLGAVANPHYKADTRQGVAVEYLTEAKTA